MVVIVLPKNNLPAKNWLLVFIFSLLTSALVLLSMQFYISSDLFITNTGMGVYSFLGVMRSILDIVGWGALVLFILSFRNTPIEAAQENNQNTDKVNEYIPTDINTDAANSSEVSTAQYLYFFGFAIVIGGCIVTPLTLPHILGLFSPEAANVYLAYPAGRKILFCLLLVGLASFAYADELRFSLFKYIAGMVVLGGAIATQAVKEYYSGKGVILPVGLLGIAYATIFGHLGLWVCNAIAGKEERNKQTALILGLTIFPLLAISALVFFQNKSDPVVIAEVETQRSPKAESSDKPTVISPTSSNAVTPAPSLLLDDIQEYTHSNGLTVKRPYNFTKSLAKTGFVFTESGDIRSPRFIALSVSDNEPDFLLEKQRVLKNGSTVTYSVEALASNSGGTEYELSSAKKIGERWITLNAIEQSEVGIPSFEVAWIVIESAKLRKPKSK
jgi:hypothetical protein